MTRYGLISPFWLPRWGGANRYHHTLAEAMLKAGLSLKVFCGTAEEAGRDNGTVPVERHVPRGNFANTGWYALDQKNNLALRTEIAKQYEFMSAALEWCRRNRIEVALIGSPLQVAYMYHAREFHLRLKDMGVRVGVVHHDLPKAIESMLFDFYLGSPDGWGGAAKKAHGVLNGMLADGGRMHCALLSGSPLIFEPDFVIANSLWSGRFLDPSGRTPVCVLHPMMDEAWWAAAPRPDPSLGPVEALMVNPEIRKGLGVMRDIINGAPSDWRFRVLKGGWGDAFEGFHKAVASSAAVREGRVDFHDYVADMRNAYRASGVLVFPSLAEGYGMTPVEAMLAGTPVVATSHPAVLEAVGEGALTLCPFRNKAPEWRDAIARVLAERPLWQRRGRERGAFLAERQTREFSAFLGFLGQQAAARHRAVDHHPATDAP